MQRSGGERCRHAGSSSPAPRAPCTPAAAQHQRRQAQEHHSGTAPQQGSQIGHTRHTRNHAASRRDSISAAGGRPAAASGPLLAIRWPKASQVRVSQVRCQSMQSRGRQVVFTAAMSCSRGARGCGRRWCCCHRARRWRQFIRRSATAARRLLSPQCRRPCCRACLLSAPKSHCHSHRTGAATGGQKRRRAARRSSAWPPSLERRCEQGEAEESSILFKRAAAAALSLVLSQSRMARATSCKLARSSLAPSPKRLRVACSHAPRRA
jgi:hypothetical protein